MVRPRRRSPPPRTHPSIGKLGPPPPPPVPTHPFPDKLALPPPPPTLSHPSPDKLGPPPPPPPPSTYKEAIVAPTPPRPPSNPSARPRVYPSGHRVSGPALSLHPLIFLLNPYLRGRCFRCFERGHQAASCRESRRCLLYINRGHPSVRCFLQRGSTPLNAPRLLLGPSLASPLTAYRPLAASSLQVPPPIPPLAAPSLLVPRWSLCWPSTIRFDLSSCSTFPG